MRGPNFTKLGKDTGRSWQHCTLVSDFGHLVAFSNAGGLKLSVLNDAKYGTFWTLWKLWERVCEISIAIVRDVPNIRFRFRLAGYPAIFGYPVPVPVPAKILAVAGYCSRIIYLFNGAKNRYYYKYNNSFWHWYHQFNYIPLLFLYLQQQPNEAIQQNRSTWQLLKTTCTNHFYY